MSILKHGIRKTLKTLLLAAIISLIAAQGLGFITQKIALENSLRDKIYSEIGRMIDKSKFVVVVNIELGKKVTGINQDPTQITSTGPSKTTNSDIETTVPTGSSSMDFLPGVPMAGPDDEQSQGPPTTTIPNKTQKIQAGNNQQGSAALNGELQLTKVNVSVYLEETMATGAHEKAIESLIQSIIPITAGCADCIRIETMRFQETKEKSELTDLRQKIEQMEKDKRQEEIDKLTGRFDDLKEELLDSEEQRRLWEDQARQDRDFQRRQDSTRLAKLEAEEHLERKQLDTLLSQAQFRLDTVIDARIESETSTKKDLIDIIKYGQGNLTSEDDEGGLLGMRGGGSSDSNTVLLLGLGAAIFILLLLLMFRKNQQDVVYLKPKGDKKKEKKGKSEKKSKKEAKNEDGDEVEVAQATSPAESQTPPANPYATLAFEDDNVLRSELRALRQSAVSLSVSQREGATQIVKDWLSDGAEDAAEEGGEE